MGRIWAQEPPFEGSDPVGPPPFQPGGPPFVAGVGGPKAIVRAARWAAGVIDPSAILAVDATVLDAQRQKVVSAWREAGCTEAPHFSSSLWFALGPDAGERLARYTYQYLRIFGDGLARDLASTAVVHSPSALRDAVAAADAAGCDEFFLVPTTADPDELDRCREALGI